MFSIMGMCGGEWDWEILGSEVRVADEVTVKVGH